MQSCLWELYRKKQQRREINIFGNISNIRAENYVVSSKPKASTKSKPFNIESRLMLISHEEDTQRETVDDNANQTNEERWSASSNWI